MVSYYFVNRLQMLNIFIVYFSNDKVRVSCLTVEIFVNCILSLESISETISYRAVFKAGHLSNPHTNPDASFTVQSKKLFPGESFSE